MARPLKGADFVELGERWVPELDPPSVPPRYGRKVIAAYRRGKLTEARALELLWGSVSRSDLPPTRGAPGGIEARIRAHCVTPVEVRAEIAVGAREIPALEDLLAAEWQRDRPIVLRRPDCKDILTAWL